MAVKLFDNLKKHGTRRSNPARSIIIKELEEHMNRVTLEQFKSFGQCWLIDNGGDKKSEARLYLLAKRFPNGATALDILGLDISANEKMWSVLRPEFIPAPILDEAGCCFGEWVLNIVEEELGIEPDSRSLEGIACKRRWLRGEATDKELAAARNAAWDAVWSVRDAAWNAAWDAAWDTARDAACVAARGVARYAWEAAGDVTAWDAVWDITAWEAARDVTAWYAAGGAGAAETELVAILRELLEKWEQEGENE
jgi:hypothetical protein